MYRAEPMTPAAAKRIAQWEYEEPYALYGFAADPEAESELLNGDYAACYDEDDLIGFFCRGASARIPTRESCPYPDGMEDLGLGLRPDLCGRGLGEAFVQFCMGALSHTSPGRPLRLTVACFNRRAIAVYARCGFAAQRTVHHASGRPFCIMVRE